MNLRSALLLAALFVVGATRTQPSHATIPDIGYPGAASFSMHRCEKNFVTDYGADPTGSEDCRDDLIEFLASTEEYLYIPAGTYYFGFPDDYMAIECDRSVTITGAGESNTKLKIGPDYPDAYAILFQLTAPCDVSVQGLTIEGPAHPTYNSQIESSPWSFAFYVDSYASSTPTTVTVDHVKFSQVNYALYSYGGGTSPTIVKATNCDFSVWNQAVTLYRGEGTGHGMILEDCTFHRWGKSPSGTYYGTNIYNHDHIGASIKRCIFDNDVGVTNQFALRIGGGGSMTSVPTMGYAIEDSQFDTDGRILLGCNDHAYVTGCELNDADAWHQFGGTITFADSVINGATIYGPSSGGAFTFNNCLFESGNFIWTTGTEIEVNGGEYAGGYWMTGGTCTTVWDTVDFTGGYMNYPPSLTGAQTFTGCTYNGTNFRNGPDYNSGSTPSCSTCTSD